jgi:hypothetical protein
MIIVRFRAKARVRRVVRVEASGGEGPLRRDPFRMNIRAAMAEGTEEGRRSNSTKQLDEATQPDETTRRLTRL